MTTTEAVMLSYLISSRPSKCVNFFGQTVHTIQHIGYVTAQILTGSDIIAQILTTHFPNMNFEQEGLDLLHQHAITFWKGLDCYFGKY